MRKTIQLAGVPGEFFLSLSWARPWRTGLRDLLPTLDIQPRNPHAQNYDFERKKKACFGSRQGISSCALTTQVLNTATSTVAVAEQRQAVGDTAR